MFAVAGRIEGDEARITNHPWVISRQRDAGRAAVCAELRLVNDFAAQAMAIELLTARTWSPIGELPFASRRAATRTYAVLGPGTGLGVSALIVRDGRAIALETEGGHVSFAANAPSESGDPANACRTASAACPTSAWSAAAAWSTSIAR